VNKSMDNHDLLSVTDDNRSQIIDSPSTVKNLSDDEHPDERRGFDGNHVTHDDSMELKVDQLIEEELSTEPKENLVVNSVEISQTSQTTHDFHTPKSSSEVSYGYEEEPENTNSVEQETTKEQAKVLGEAEEDVEQEYYTQATEGRTETDCAFTASTKSKSGSSMGSQNSDSLANESTRIEEDEEEGEENESNDNDHEVPHIQSSHECLDLPRFSQVCYGDPTPVKEEQKDDPISGELEDFEMPILDSPVDRRCSVIKEESMSESDFSTPKKVVDQDMDSVTSEVNDDDSGFKTPNMKRDLDVSQEKRLQTEETLMSQEGEYLPEQQTPTTTRKQVEFTPSQEHQQATMATPTFSSRKLQNVMSSTGRKRKTRRGGKSSNTFYQEEFSSDSDVTPFCLRRRKRRPTKSNAATGRRSRLSSKSERKTTTSKKQKSKKKKVVQEDPIQFEPVTLPETFEHSHQLDFSESLPDSRMVRELLQSHKPRRRSKRIMGLSPSDIVDTRGASYLRFEEFEVSSKKQKAEGEVSNETITVVPVRSSLRNKNRRIYYGDQFDTFTDLFSSQRTPKPKARRGKKSDKRVSKSAHKEIRYCPNGSLNNFIDYDNRDQSRLIEEGASLEDLPELSLGI